MPAKTRIIIVSLLILLGGVLFSYCLFFYPIEIATPVQGGSAAVTGLNVKDASTAASEQDKSSQTGKSSSEGRSRPKAGAT